MKKFLVFSLISVILLGGFCVNAKAETIDEFNGFNVISEEVEYLDNGLTIVTTIYDEVTPSPGISLFAASYSTSKTKTQTVKNGDNILFTFSIKGTFTVNPGISATCTAVSYSHTIGNSAWSLDSASTSKSGGTAKGTGLFKKRLLFIVVDSLELNVTLKCDVNGNFS